MKSFISSQLPLPPSSPSQSHTLPLRPTPCQTSWLTKSPTHTLISHNSSSELQALPTIVAPTTTTRLKKHSTCLKLRSMKPHQSTSTNIFCSSLHESFTNSSGQLLYRVLARAFFRQPKGLTSDRSFSPVRGDNSTYRVTTTSIYLDRS